MFVTEAGEIDFEDDEDEEEVEDRDGDVGTWNLVDLLNVFPSSEETSFWPPSMVYI